MTTADPFLAGFTLRDIDAGGVRIRAATGGSGPPLLLLHGHPQTHSTWHAVAPALARRFCVVAMDLRGYGDSDKPEGGADHGAYAKRAMAADAVAVMRALGHARFAVVGHDRGGRVAHRLALGDAAPPFAGDPLRPVAAHHLVHLPAPAEPPGIRIGQFRHDMVDRLGPAQQPRRARPARVPRMRDLARVEVSHVVIGQPRART